MIFPRLALGELNRATRSHTDLSGKGVNVSVALRLFDIDSTAMGFAAGVYGRILVTGLREKGQRCDFVQVSGETRSNVTVIDAQAGVTTKLNEPGPTVCADDIRQLEERLLARLQPDDLCILSGSLPPGAPADTYARLIDISHRRGGLAVLDTSGAALAAGCAAGPDLLKPNDIEAANLTGLPVDGEAELQAAVGAMLDLGAKRILLSLGSRGALYADGQALWRATPPGIREVSAVGAGDAALSGCLWAWLQNLSGDQVARWAVAAGTAAAMVDGSAMPTRRRIEDIYDQVRVEPLGRLND